MASLRLHFTPVFLLPDVKLTHPSNDVSQDDVVMFQDPLVLMGQDKKRRELVLFFFKAGDQRRKEESRFRFACELL